MPDDQVIDYGTSTGGLFEWALTTMKANMIVKRKGWGFAIRLHEDGKWFEMLVDDDQDRPLPYTVTTADLLARDWDTV